MKTSAAAFALILAAAGSAHSETITKERFGCHSQPVVERLFQLVQAGDESGFGQLLQSSLASGECRSWKKDEEVSLEDRTMGYACLIPKATGGKCYWTPISAIDK